MRSNTMLSEAKALSYAAVNRSRDISRIFADSCRLVLGACNVAIGYI